MEHHAIHLVAAAAIVAGLFATSWAIERRASGSAATAGGPGLRPVTRSREMWERSLFGLPSASMAASIPTITPVVSGGHPLDVVGTAAALSFLAGAIHIAALPGHLDESLLFAGFFLLSGAFQVATGFALRTRASRGLWVAVLAANAGVVGLWVLSRTTGVPVGPRPWIPERIGPLDAAATLCEIALVVLAALTLRRGRAGSEERA
jgi:hypothetical protein